MIRDKQPVSLVLPEFQQMLASQSDRDFVQHVCMGLLRQYLVLQEKLQTLLSKPLKAKDMDIHVLLLVGMYQIQHMRVPNYAAISETVDAAKRLKKRWAAGLVNKILRLFSEQLDDSVAFEATAMQAHPAWLITALQQRFPDRWQQVVETNMTPPMMALRIHTQQISIANYAVALDAMQLEYILPETDPQAVLLIEPQPVKKLPGFNDGWFYVQDLASQRVAALMDIQPGQRVLDACAAPGGKTTHMLSNHPDVAMLVAVDNQAQRLAKITENLQRCQLQAAPCHLVMADACRPDVWWDGQHFDRILIDAPCSATGVIRRHPDIMHHRQPDDLMHLSQVQVQLLKRLWPLLAPGGQLLYTTCSIFAEENEQVIQLFCRTQPDASVESIDMPTAMACDAGVQLLPSQQHDGFYYCRLRKQ